MKMQQLRFNIYHKVFHPLKVFVMELSWLPIWYARKYPHPAYFRGTPAATIKRLSEKVEQLEQESEHRWKKWHECEEALRAERMSRAADGMSPEQKNNIQRVFGVRFRGSEKN